MATSKTVQGDIEPGKEVVSEDPKTRLYRALNERERLQRELKAIRAEVKDAQVAFLRHIQNGR